MSTVKTKIEEEVVLNYLKDNFDNSVSTIKFINGGETSQAFSFDTNTGSFVIRVNKSDRAFYKDAYAYDHFACEAIPIPKIIEIGKLDENYFFAISKKAEGKHIEDLSETEYNNIFPELMSILDAIHTVDITDTTGYGKWNPEGEGKYDSWHEFIMSIKNSQDRENIFENSFLERDVWENICNKIEDLSQYCPEERYLVHGDYGNNNAVSDGERVTGVFDWADSMYGDPVYDVAWLTFWHKSPEKIKQIEEYYMNRGIPNFSERLLCYKLRIGLSSISFYAFSNQKNKYDSIKERMLNLIKD
jgi:hygromycin-B 4-O-kinase